MTEEPTTLEAWALGTPVLSLTVDPGGIITEHGLGRVCGGDMDKLVDALRCGSYRVAPEKLRHYVQEYNSMAAASRTFVKAVN